MRLMFSCLYHFHKIKSSYFVLFYSILSCYACVPKMGSLSWNDSEGATHYLVTAETSNGHKVELRTVNTSATIPDLLCGENYILSVEAGNDMCISAPSQTAQLKTGRLLALP
uniref:Fibronectin type-III domain-containing protein n=1 Tax=Myripristis murdjan TaxID=586833 RepID=A0A667XFG4_9TELE